jgi:hypothetical protein
MAGVNTRIDALRVRIQESLSYTLDRLFSEAQDTYFTIEDQLEEMDRLLTTLWEDAARTHDKPGLRRLSERVSFLEDRFEEVDSALRGRPRRVRRKFSFYSFFQQWQDGTSEARYSAEVSSRTEAYQILGVEAGCPLSEITKAFRKSLKSLHPDVRGGDRSAEPELRKLIAAYTFIKKDMAGSR